MKRIKVFAWYYLRMKVFIVELALISLYLHLSEVILFKLLCFYSSAADSYAANCVVNEGESVYDFCWYPYMSASGIFVTLSWGEPVKFILLLLL